MKRILIILLLGLLNLTRGHAQITDEENHSLISLELSDDTFYSSDAIVSYSIETIVTGVGNGYSEIFIEFKSGVKKRIDINNIKEMKFFGVESKSEFLCVPVRDMLLIQLYKSEKITLFRRVSNKAVPLYYRLGSKKKLKGASNTSRSIMKQLKCKELNEKFGYKSTKRMSRVSISKSIEMFKYYSENCK